MVLADARQLEDLRRAYDNALEAVVAAEKGFGEEVAAPLLKESIKRLSSITGEDIDEEVLEKIFSQFCIGK